MKPSEATISSMTSCGTGASVVTAITATSEPPPASSPGERRPTAALEMFTPCSPKQVPTRPTMPGTSL